MRYFISLGKAIAVTLLVLVGMLVSALVRQPISLRSGVPETLIGNIVQFVVILPVVILVLRGERRASVPYKERRWLLMCPPLIFVIANICKYPLTEIPGPVPLLCVLSTVLFIALSEELPFRLVMYEILAVISLGWYLVWSSLLFGVLHILVHGMVGFVPTTLLGLVFGIARVAGAPIWILVIFHALLDLPDRLPHERNDFGLILAGLAFLVSAIVGAWLLLNAESWKPPNYHMKSDGAKCGGSR